MKKKRKQYHNYLICMEKVVRETIVVRRVKDKREARRKGNDAITFRSNLIGFKIDKIEEIK